MTPMRPGTRSLIGVCLVWLSFLLFLSVFTRFLDALIPPASPLPVRLWLVLGVACAALLAAAAATHDRSIAWQTPLRGFVFAAMVVGVAHLVAAVFGNRAFLWSPAGALCAGYLFAGVGAARWLSHLQGRPDRGHSRHAGPYAAASRDPHSASARWPPGSLKSLREEVRAGTYLQNASTRASRRKSAWNLLLLLVVPVWMLLWGAGVWLAGLAKSALLGGHALAIDWAWPRAIAPLFAYFPLLFGALVPAMVLVNYFIYYLVPPARRAMDAEDQAFPGTEYSTQQPILLRLTWMILPPAFVLAVLGQIFL